MKVLVINGPNMNLLGQREPGIYGSETLADLERLVVSYGVDRNVEVNCFQSNHEGELIDELHKARGVYQGIIYNPAAHTHYSYALRDAVAAIDIPTVEVHLSNIESREDFRKTSVIKPVCIAQIAGKGFAGYLEALDVLLKHTHQ